MFGPSGVDCGWLWSDSGPWSCVVRRVRRSVLVSPSPLVLRNGGAGCESRRFGRRARLGMALLPVVLTYSRGSGGIVVIQYVYRRVRRSVLVSPSPLVLRNGGAGCESRRFGRRARLGMALLPVVLTYSRGSGGIVVIQYVYCSKA